MFHKRIYLVHNIQGGGTLKYIRDLQFPFVEIHNQAELRSHTFHPYDLMLVQQLCTDITPADLVRLKEETGIHLIVCIHDFFWFQVHSVVNPRTCASAYLSPPTISEDTRQLFERASLVIHPSEFTRQHYAKHFPTHNTLVQPHNDLVQRDAKCTNRVFRVLRIGILHERSECKGEENIQWLQKRYPSYKGYAVQFVHCTHTEDNWQDWVPKMHGWLHLNKWGETYCYGLTKSLNSGLPILYNNVGVYRERIPAREHYFKVAESEEEYTNTDLLYQRFEAWADYLLAKQGKYTFSFLHKEMIYRDLYTFLCTNHYVPSIYKKIHEKVQPFAVYFPQFHSLTENNVNYYPGMTDTVNLYHYNRTNVPLNAPLLAHPAKYDATQLPLVREQVRLAKSYGVYGFAVYYYWFTTNDITDKHTIMEKCYNLFFQELDFPVFFVWANEDWSNNPAFNTGHTITNTYDEYSFRENIRNLMRYFNHPNYYKRNNRPVFYIHHTWCMKPEEQDVFIRRLHEACVANGFDGIYLKRNGVEYEFHPNYKKTFPIDYTAYVDQVEEPDCMFFDFNNRPRFHFNKTKPCTVYTNVTEKAQDQFMKKALRKDIVLLNAWNEWGEDMAMEPGTHTGDTRLLMLKHNCLPFLSN
jgi:hypothetical protein